MSHQIYTTNAVIMNIFPDGEDSVIAECLTQDLGRIYVHIQGVKKMPNKHRMFVFLGAWVIIDCVQGKQYYRCTGITEWVNVAPVIRIMTLFQKKSLAKVFGLIQRLVPTGIPIPDIFNVYQLFFHQITQENIDDYRVQILSLVVQLRILGILGYWNSDWSDSVFDEQGKTFAYVASHTGAVKKLIDRILIETQMNEKNPG